MNKHIATILLFPILLLVATSSVSQEKGKGKEKDKETLPNKATPADYQRLASAGSFTGKVSMGAKSVTFIIDDSDYRKQLKIASKAKTPAEQKAAVARVENQFAALKWALGKEFVLELEPKVSLRKLHAPTVEFDERGFPKTPKNQPGVGGVGYPASIEDFGGDYLTTISFGARGKDGRPMVRQAVVNNRAW